MFTIKEITEKIKEARDFAREKNVGNLDVEKQLFLDVDLQLFDDGNWEFHIRKEYQPDGTGYWASTWIEPEDNDDECKETALALVANINISNNDQLKRKDSSVIKRIVLCRS